MWDMDGLTVVVGLIGEVMGSQKRVERLGRLFQAQRAEK